MLGSIGYKNCYKCTKYQYYSTESSSSCKLIFKFSFKGALNALKRKKRLAKQLQQIDGTLSTIEFQRQALENANTNTEVLNSMKYAANALKQAQQL